MTFASDGKIQCDWKVYDVGSWDTILDKVTLKALVYVYMLNSRTLKQTAAFPTLPCLFFKLLHIFFPN